MILIRWIAGTVFAIAAVLFAVANLRVVSVVWSPVHAGFDVPLSVFALGMMAAGFVMGGVVVWINAQPLRSERRAQKKRIHDLEMALEAANENRSFETVSPPPLLPSLSPPSPS